MSFILDALKKLEQKRQQGAVPDLTTIHVHERQKHEKRALWPYLVLGGLVLNAGILSFVFRPWETGNNNTPASVPAQQYGKKNDPVSASQQVNNNAVVTDKKPVITKPSPAALRHAPDIKKAATVAEHEDAPAPLQAKVKEQSPVEQPSLGENQDPVEDDPSALGLNPSPQQIDDLRKIIKEETSRSAVVTSRKEPSAGKAYADAEEQVPDISQLPEETKRELPQIVISAHIFSNNQRSRIVNINGSTVKEGDEVIRGLKVSQITMSGVIFDYQGQRFQVRAF
ncbi:MAG: hypothetical protein C4581_06790 [Nitrospiraceae bacterium]|nr:MAG: hypothetical protein C4581_06790 [Nitrospiraceae bacterium]